MYCIGVSNISFNLYVFHIAGKPRYDLGSNEDVEYFGKGKFTYIITMLVT
jgi:hypothetical protein